MIAPRVIPDQEEQRITELLKDCTIISLDDRIKEKYVELRKRYQLKLADATIAATAIAYNLPLITGDERLKVIEELQLVTYQHDITLARNIP